MQEKPAENRSQQMQNSNTQRCGRIANAFFWVKPQAQILVRIRLWAKTHVSMQQWNFALTAFWCINHHLNSIESNHRFSEQQLNDDDDDGDYFEIISISVSSDSLILVLWFQFFSRASLFAVVLVLFSSNKMFTYIHTLIIHSIFNVDSF